LVLWCSSCEGFIALRKEKKMNVLKKHRWKFIGCKNRNCRGRSVICTKNKLLNICERKVLFDFVSKSGAQRIKEM
jgi:hypothetical protein